MNGGLYSVSPCVCVCVRLCVSMCSIHARVPLNVEMLMLEMKLFIVVVHFFFSNINGSSLLTLS